MEPVRVGGLEIPGRFAHEPRYASALYLLGSMWPDDRVACFLVCDAAADIVSIDFRGMLELDKWSSPERLILGAASVLFGVPVADGDDSVGAMVEILNEAQLARVQRAIRVRRKRMSLSEAIEADPSLTEECRVVGQVLLDLLDRIQFVGAMGLYIDMLHVGHRLAGMSDRGLLEAISS